MPTLSDVKMLIERWAPEPPVVEEKGKSSVTLSWSADPYSALHPHLVYTVQRKEKVPSWVLVYSGGKTRKIIDDLAPSHPHKFRLKIALRFGSLLEAQLNKINLIEDIKAPERAEDIFTSDGTNTVGSNTKDCKTLLSLPTEGVIEKSINGRAELAKSYVESRWSEEVWTSTQSDGTTATCFCMAVRCGYIKQVQQMLEERPMLLEAINSTNGFTPLATAVRKGDINTVRLLVSMGAAVDQASSTTQTPLHLSALGGHVAIIDLLLDSGADSTVRDVNGLRLEHCAVDSGSLATVRAVFSRGGDVTRRDSNGWTPLFRAIIQGSSSEIVEELINRGSEVEIIDKAGLSLLSAARLLKDRHGRRRDSILRLVDIQYQHEKAVENFTRLTKKISSMQTLITKK